MEEVVDWANGTHEAKVYWMSGMAGTGKTTIAWSLCKKLEDESRLGASFFCSRLLPGCQDVARIVPSVSHQLAGVSAPFRDELCRVLQDDQYICSADVASQFTKLISEPLQKAGQIIRGARLVVVIDALDECSDRAGAQFILDALFQCATHLPIKFFVTCRPEPGLFDKVLAEGEAARSIFHLHDIKESLVQADIETYLSMELASIPVSSQQIKLLAERSGKLFIYAATVVRYLRPSTMRVNIGKRLTIVLGTASNSSSSFYGPLDSLYTAILSAALENTELESWDIESIKLMLYTVLCAREPMSIETLAQLLKCEGTDEARQGIEPLRSVLHVSDVREMVSTLHASFPDYLRDRERSGRFWCDEATHHELIAERCFDAMRILLRFNICRLESSFVPDEDVPDITNRIEKAIPSHLFYACRYWNEHIVRSSNVTVHASVLEGFLKNQVLFWVEVMNLKKCMELGASILSEIYSWMKRANLSDNACALCLDAQRFASVFGASPAGASTPHIYVSVLALWDRVSPMWTQYGTRTKGLGAQGSALDNRQSGLLVSWIARGGITSVAVSHDGRRVVTSSWNHELHVWSTYTGALLAGPFIGHTDTVHSVTFSRDGGRIASTSRDCTVRVWDAHKGHALGTPFQGHQSAVTAVAFSPDGARLASGSEDSTMRIWDIQTGQAVAGPFRGHPNSLTSIAYSLDGGRILSSSYDGTIYIWNAHTGDVVAGSRRGDRFLGRVLAFSSDGSHFVSGDYSGAIQVWDIQTGQKVGNPFTEHQSAAVSVAFNPSGTHIVSGHKDGVIRVWDVQTNHQHYQHDDNPKLFLFGDFNLLANSFLNDYHIFSASSAGSIHVFNTQAAQTLPGAAVKQVHPGVRSVHFLPDGHRVVSGCIDGTICIWDAHTGDMLVGPFKTHSGTESFALSPAGVHIASGSRDNTICIWDTQTGRRVVGPLEGHIEPVNSVAYSPDGSCLVSGSWDRTIRVWDSQTGRALAGPFKGHTDWVRSVAYSPDGKHIVSGSNDGTVRVWDAQTGQTVVGPLKGHTDSVKSVAFSPNGSRIVFGCYAYTIGVWDAQTGHAVGKPFKGHTNSVTSVTYSPNGSRIVCGTLDDTVCVWDAETGHAEAGPYKAHTQKVTSVAYSPDGNYFASGSEDGSIRIWRSQIGSGVDPLDNWRMTGDGWIVGSDSSMLLWIPQELRPALVLPQNAAFIRPEGVLRLKLKDARIGSRWAECFSG
ncbi:hypothetical protein FS749_005265 [Ceratobasidium sp. UAMH 11750]|nr:hypothetical protein FS749_005265 [Ceratobasidium sp. UAMH 11750]